MNGGLPVFRGEAALALWCGLRSGATVFTLEFGYVDEPPEAHIASGSSSRFVASEFVCAVDGSIRTDSHTRRPSR